MNTLARQLRATDYFTLGWGTMVGVGWLVIMDDWLLRGGALGALLGFVIGGSLLLPIGWVYGKLVVAMPDAASAPGRPSPSAASPATSSPASIRWNSTASPAAPCIFRTSSSASR